MNTGLVRFSCLTPSVLLLLLAQTPLLSVVRADGDGLAKDLPAAAATPEPEPLRNRFSLGLGVSSFDYAEELQLPAKSTEKGTLWSVRLDWLHDGSVWLKGAYWGASLEFSPSSTHYDGSTQPDYLPLQQDTANQFYRLNGFFGFHFLDWVSSYSGLGARVWLRGTSRVNAGVFTAAEQYYWLELPLGLRLEQGWGSSWSFALDASIRWLFLGGIAIKFSEVASNRSDSTGALGNRLGAKLEGSARCRLSERFSVGLVPWLEYSAIGKGGNFDIVTAGQATVQGYEPASRSWEYGLRLEASFHQ